LIEMVLSKGDMEIAQSYNELLVLPQHQPLGRKLIEQFVERMFKFQMVGAVVAGLVLAGSTAFGGVQDQTTQPVNKKGQPQTVSTKASQPLPTSTKGQVPTKAKGQDQAQEPVSKGKQPMAKGKGKVIVKAQKNKKTQPQPQPRPQQPQPEPQPQ
jgi:hypothetical protein